MKTNARPGFDGGVPTALLGALALGDERLHRRQLRLIFSHSAYVTVGVVLVSLCAALVVRPAVDGRTLALWFLASLVPVALRALCIAAWRRRPFAAQEAEHLRWATLYCLTSVLNESPGAPSPCSSTPTIRATSASSSRCISATSASPR